MTVKELLSKNVIYAEIFGQGKSMTEEEANQLPLGALIMYPAETGYWDRVYMLRVPPNSRGWIWEIISGEDEDRDSWFWHAIHRPVRIA
jgi:hypothetical protein